MRTPEWAEITVGRSTKNIETDVGKAEFEANLRDNGWVQTLTTDGKMDVFTKNGNRYGVRDESNHGNPTADYFPLGSKYATLKIRLAK